MLWQIPIPAFIRRISTSHSGIAMLMLAAMLAAWTAPHLVHDPEARDPILLIAILIGSLPLCVETLREICKGNFGVDTLAVISIATALVFREYWVAAIIILMFSGGKFLEEFATRRASSVLSALARRMPQIAHRLEPDSRICDVATDVIAVGDTLAVHPHELCPVDGVVIAGNGTMDESYLTGEPFLIAKAPGALVLSGAINGDAALTIRATARANNSRYAKIVEVLQASEKNRPRMRRLGERVGAWYTPLSVAIAALTWGLTGQPDRFLAVLVIATPCPLLLAIPVAIIGAISMSARKGIVIKDPSILEKLDTCRTLIVDKTGTLTYGRPYLTDVICFGDWSRRDVLQIAGSLEQYSKHPLAPAVLTAAKEEKIPLFTPQDVFEFPGEGLRAHIEGHVVLLTGRGKLPEHLGKQIYDAVSGLECVVLIDGCLAGLLRFRDEPRQETKPFLQHVKLLHGFKSVVLLSGDRPSEVALFAAKMGITHNYGGESPEGKVAIVKQLTANEPTLYIGDGINDAPAMLNATAAIALGVNSDITSEAAGAVILQSSLESVDELIHIGSRMRRIALTSAVGGMGLSAIGMAASALGYLAPIEGAVLQEVIDLLAILNSLRMILPVGSVGDFKVSTCQPPQTQITGSTAIAPLR
jgi:heavy metal translocating P-type ATPase